MRRLLGRLILWPVYLVFLAWTRVDLLAGERVRRRAELRAWRQREKAVRRTWQRLADSNREFLERVA